MEVLPAVYYERYICKVVFESMSQTPALDLSIPIVCHHVRTTGKEDKGKEQGRISVLQLSSIVMVRQQKTDYCLRLIKILLAIAGICRTAEDRRRAVFRYACNYPGR